MESGARDVFVDPIFVKALAMDHGSITIDVVDAGVVAHLEHPSTTRPKSAPSTTVSSK